MVSVGIVGGSGYMGGEALRVLLRHPHAEVAWVSSRSPGPIEQVHPNLYDTGLHFVRLEDVKTLDFVLLALPTGASIAVAGRFLQAGARVIDLGAAFRLHERPTWERVYGQPHTAWPLVHEAVYGVHLLEVFRQFYQGQPFVKVYDQPQEEEDTWHYKPYQWVSAVAGTNYCYPYNGVCP